MNGMNEVTYYILRHYGTRQHAALALGMANSALSTILKGYRKPSKNELAKLKAALSPYHFRKFFGKPRVEKIRGEHAVNE